MPAQNRTVMPVRRPNAELRTREYVNRAEVERLMKAAKGNRWGDGTLAWLTAYRHGPRAIPTDPVGNGDAGC